MKWFILLVAFFIAGSVQGQGQDVSCTGQPEYYENGQLRYCELSENMTIQGKSYRKGDAVRFNPDGTLVNAPGG